MVKEDFNNNEKGSLLSDEQIVELDRRVKNFEEGKSKMYPWEEVKARILKKHAQKLKEQKSK